MAIFSSMPNFFAQNSSVWGMQAFELRMVKGNRLSTELNIFWLIQPTVSGVSPHLSTNPRMIPPAILINILYICLFADS